MEDAGKQGGMQDAGGHGAGKGNHNALSRDCQRYNISEFLKQRP